VSAVRGKVCVVTGAASGIGRALALELSARGARVAACDLNGDALAGVGEHQQVLDVSDHEAVDAYAAAVAEHFGVVHQLYNNAGIAFSRPVLESDHEDYERVLGVNLWGVIHGTRAFLPHLIASGDGHVVNVSSLNGYLAQPNMSHYCTSKFAVRGFTEALRMEMAEHPVRVTVVHPGGVRTEIANAAMRDARERGLPITAEQERRHRLYNEKLLRMDPAQAARIVVDGVEAGRPRVLVGTDAKLVDVFVRLLPARYPSLMQRFERRLGGG
jgi:NAD(P)-dependent dehydrogenase (short-subunit alcohol dehydrogenase family)